MQNNVIIASLLCFFLSCFLLIFLKYLFANLDRWKLKEGQHWGFAKQLLMCHGLAPISVVGCRWQQGALTFLKQMSHLMEIALFLPYSLHSRQELVRFGDKQVGLQVMLCLEGATVLLYRAGGVRCKGLQSKKQNKAAAAICPFAHQLQADPEPRGSP